MLNFKETKNKSALSTRWAQMSKQEQIIERKKMEIQAKVEAQKQAAALSAQAKLSNSNKTDNSTGNIFSNDGSFMSQYKALLEKQKLEKEKKEEKEKLEEEKNLKQNENRQKHCEIPVKSEISDSYKEQFTQDIDQINTIDRPSRDRIHRWSDGGSSHHHSPTTPDQQNKNDDKSKIPPLMQIPIRTPDHKVNSQSRNQWNQAGSDSESDSNNDDKAKTSHEIMDPPASGTTGSPQLLPGSLGHGTNTSLPMSSMGLGQIGPGSIGPGPMRPCPMGPGPIRQSLLGPGPMGPGPMGLGPMGQGPMIHGPMGHGPMGPGPMGPGPIGPGPMGHGPIGPGPMGPGPMGPNIDAMRPMGNNGMGPNHMGPNGPMNMGPIMPQGPNGSMPNIANMGPMMPPGGPNMPPMPPFLGGPNFPMPPNFMGPNGPRGPCPRGPCPPGSMPPNMCGPNMRGPGPNGPMGPYFGPPFPNPRMMGPNGPPNSMMPPNSMNSMPFMGPSPFGPNGPNFGPNGPFRHNGPPNMPFMPPNQIPPNSMPPISESNPLDSSNIQSSESAKVQNIQPPLPPNHKPNLQDMDPAKIPTPPSNVQVLSADMFPPPVQRAAAEVASNGDHWENVLKAIHSQDQNLWFLHNTNSKEYKVFRELVTKLRNKGAGDIKAEVKPEDKYEPEFCLEDDDSYDENRHIKQEAIDSGNMFKREDDDSQGNRDADNRRKERKRKSRWGNEPPADVKPPGVVAPLPTAGTKLAKIDEEGVKLTNVNRNNPALMQYAMTNYGTTNLSAEDWKKCEDNFKLNLLYQDMLKKRQEVDRLAAAGKHKYEYDSDEDTSEGTWEHRLRAKEMCATEKWADELTKQAAGKHHIGDFLPPEELKKFMEKYSAVKSGKEPDLSDYKEFKLKEDNVGFKMLQKLGWNEGQGLGAEGSGIVEPINKAHQPVANLGLGASNSDTVSQEDDEFDAYRKRMMLAYRFRPNPLNNPRRPYY